MAFTLLPSAHFYTPNYTPISSKNAQFIRPPQASHASSPMTIFTTCPYLTRYNYICHMRSLGDIPSLLDNIFCVLQILSKTAQFTYPYFIAIHSNPLLP